MERYCLTDDYWKSEVNGEFLNLDGIYTWYEIGKYDEDFESTGEYIQKRDAYNILYDPEKFDKEHGRYWNFRKISDIDFENSEKGDEDILGKRWDYIVRGKPGKGIYHTNKTPWDYIRRYGDKNTFTYQNSQAIPDCFVYENKYGIAELYLPGRLGNAGAEETAESMNEYIEKWKEVIADGKDKYITFAQCQG